MPASLSPISNLDLPVSKEKVLTKQQKNRVVRNRLSAHNPHLVKWFAKQVKVNDLVRFEFEWRSRYFPKMREILTPAFIQSLKSPKSIGR